MTPPPTFISHITRACGVTSPYTLDSHPEGAFSYERGDPAKFKPSTPHGYLAHKKPPPPLGPP